MFTCTGRALISFLAPAAPLPVGAFFFPVALDRPERSMGAHGEFYKLKSLFLNIDASSIPCVAKFSVAPSSRSSTVESSRRRDKELKSNDGCDGRHGYGGRSGECGARRRSPLGHPGMTHLKNNEAPANDRGCVADVSHVS
jgi:hypothetical protein